MAGKLSKSSRSSTSSSSRSSSSISKSKSHSEASSHSKPESQSKSRSRSPSGSGSPSQSKSRSKSRTESQSKSRSESVSKSQSASKSRSKSPSTSTTKSGSEFLRKTFNETRKRKRSNSRDRDEVDSKQHSGRRHSRSPSSSPDRMKDAVQHRGSPNRGGNVRGRSMRPTQPRGRGPGTERGLMYSQRGGAGPNRGPQRNEHLRQPWGDTKGGRFGAPPRRDIGMHELPPQRLPNMLNHEHVRQYSDDPHIQQFSSGRLQRHAYSSDTGPEHIRPLHPEINPSRRGPGKLGSHGVSLPRPPPPRRREMNSGASLHMSSSSPPLPPPPPTQRSNASGPSSTLGQSGIDRVLPPHMALLPPHLRARVTPVQTSDKLAFEDPGAMPPDLSAVPLSSRDLARRHIASISAFALSLEGVVSELGALLLMMPQLTADAELRALGVAAVVRLRSVTHAAVEAATPLLQPGTSLGDSLVQAPQVQDKGAAPAEPIRPNGQAVEPPSASPQLDNGKKPLGSTQEGEVREQDHGAVGSKEGPSSGNTEALGVETPGAESGGITRSNPGPVDDAVKVVPEVPSANNGKGAKERAEREVGWKVEHSDDDKEERYSPEGSIVVKPGHGVREGGGEMFRRRQRRDAGPGVPYSQSIPGSPPHRGEVPSEGGPLHGASVSGRPPPGLGPTPGYSYDDRPWVAGVGGRGRHSQHTMRAQLPPPMDRFHEGHKGFNPGGHGPGSGGAGFRGERRLPQQWPGEAEFRGLPRHGLEGEPRGGPWGGPELGPRALGHRGTLDAEMWDSPRQRPVSREGMRPLVSPREQRGPIERGPPDLRAARAPVPVGVDRTLQRANGVREEVGSPVPEQRNARESSTDVESGELDGSVID